jgi:argininosuccinate lyase
MGKLWDKGYQLDRLAEEYEVGEDLALDNLLARADVLGSMAHAWGLWMAGLLSAEEHRTIKDCLLEALKLAEAGELTLEAGDEDIHSRLERFLTDRLGALGQKIHTGRSRNDQVLVDLRLYARDQLLEVASLAIELARTFLEFARRHEMVPMPGYTHMQRAMLSSVGLWAASYAEAIADDLRLILAAYDMNDQSPLGSAAGYGVPLDIDREAVAAVLGFSRIQRNTLYCQNSRGKFEAAILHALSQVMLDLSRFAADLLIFTTSEFGFFRVASELLTGSSIMPQKFNLDLMELLRARARQVMAWEAQVIHTVAGLPSGYNRDVQETKGPLLRGFQQVELSLKVCRRVVDGLEVDRQRLEAACTPELFAADAAYELVKQGIPFRQAYRQVAESLGELKRPDLQEALRLRRQPGAPGNLALDRTLAELDALAQEVAGRRERALHSLNRLLEL